MEKREREGRIQRNRDVEREGGLRRGGFWRKEDGRELCRKWRKRMRIRATRGNGREYRGNMYVGIGR